MNELIKTAEDLQTVNQHILANDMLTKEATEQRKEFAVELAKLAFAKKVDA